MLKYENIISQLSSAQKIRILCDIGSLSEKEYRVLGIPEIKLGNLTEACGAEFPSSFMLANSWNKTLVGNVAKTALKDMNASGVTLAITPGAKIKLSPYHAALSEDALLASELAGEYLSAVSAMGLSACIEDFSLTPGEIEWLDKTPKSRVIFEYIVKPYQLAAQNYGFEGAVISPDVQSPGYENVNSALAKIAAEEADMDGAVPICAKAGMINTVLCIANGVLCFDGVAVALEAALNKYKQMKSSVDSELIFPLDLEDEIAKGRAVSPEMIDATLDKLIDFAYACERKRVLAPDIGMDRESLALQAAKESIVLLKNDKKVLPAKKKAEVCLLGDIAMSGESGDFAEDFMKLLEEAGYRNLGMERGYDLSQDRGEELLAPALELAEKADIVFVFLGFDSERERLIDKNHKVSIPANQQVLLDRLGGKKSKIVAVVSSNHTADFVADNRADAVLLAPITVKTAANALAEVVTGEYSPCGKLANTLYLDTDIHLKKQRAYQLRDGMKSGPFIGYRYYDSAEHSVGYPFGHGIGYVDFAYSRLTVKDGVVSVTVRNMGKMKASE
ncbi:MAG: glycoside hydrolase family 3 C-terminal domain-containing protein, partial [Clostridia bacterium]|nr:glycoside hydrolase family 3 C-terminal domain-containing protein [Clostridia bacterium]